jgi:hypothetical protein
MSNTRQGPRERAAEQIAARLHGNAPNLGGCDQPCRQCDTARWAAKHGWDAALASQAERIARLERVVEAARQSSRWLNDIKYELYASVYTLTDDEFEIVFTARDNIDLALAALDEETK